MEGLDRPPAARDEAESPEATESRLIERWLAFLFVAAILIIAMGSLAAALFGPLVG